MDPSGQNYNGKVRKVSPARDVKNEEKVGRLLFVGSVPKLMESIDRDASSNLNGLENKLFSIVTFQLVRPVLNITWLLIVGRESDSDKLLF